MEARKKILLVEDDEVLASVYRARLEMEDFEVMGKFMTASKR